MGIPTNIKHEHILKAIEEAAANGIPTDRNSDAYDLEYRNKKYPPKYIISLANKYANNRELDHGEFQGGINNANKFLAGLGFRIIDKDGNDITTNNKKLSYRKRYDIPLILYLFKRFPNVIIRPLKRSWLRLELSDTLLYVNASAVNKDGAGWYDLDDNAYDAIVGNQGFCLFILGEPEKTFVLPSDFIQNRFDDSLKIEDNREGKRKNKQFRWIFHIVEKNNQFYLRFNQRNEVNISDYLNRWAIINEFSNSQPTERNYFLVQVSKDGSVNLRDNLKYRHSNWMERVPDLDHGRIKIDDILLVYFARGAISNRKQLKKVYKVKEVSTDNIEIKVEEIYNLDGISLEKIKENLETGSLSPIFNKLGTQGFNIAMIPQKDYEAVLHIANIDSQDNLDKKLSPSDIIDADYLPFLKTIELEEGIKEIQEEMSIDTRTIKQVVYSLLSGKNVILAGPVGSGKTHLAKLIPLIIWKNYDRGYYPYVVTATSDWTTYDVIGGITPKIDDNRHITYDFRDGHVTHTIRNNWSDSQYNTRKKYTDKSQTYRGAWLIIDEFNRADIDRAFGELFTALEYKSIKLPSVTKEKYEDIKIPNDFRMIATLNTFDKHYLFKMSDALKRRFAYIELAPVLDSETNDNIEKYFGLKKALQDLNFLTNIKKHVILDKKSQTYKIVGNSKLDTGIETIYHILKFIRFTKNLGTAILISMYKYLLIKAENDEDIEESIDETLTSSIIPQLETIDKISVESIHAFCDDMPQFFRKRNIDEHGFKNYDREFEKLCLFLNIEKKDLRDILINYRKKNPDEQNRLWEQYDPWDKENLVKPSKLNQFRSSLLSLTQSRDFI